MRRGIWILTAFAVVWSTIAIIGSHLSPAWLAPVVAVAAATLWAARSAPDVVDPAERRRRGRLIGLWTAAEGTAAFVVANVLGNIGRMDAFVPALAAIVGLHFLPLARGLPIRAYYATGVALVLIGAAGLAVPPALRPGVVGFGAALILWTTALALIAAARGDARR